MIGFIGIIIFISVMENLFPDTALRKSYSLILSAYILISAVSFISSVEWSFPDTVSEEYQCSDLSGEELTKFYFCENIKSVIERRWDIPPECTEVEISVSENREISVRKIIFTGVEKANFGEIEKTFGAEVDVNDA